MKWSSPNHNAIKMFSLSKIKWRIKFFCSEPGTILTVNLTTLMEWEDTHLYAVKIKAFLVLLLFLWGFFVFLFFLQTKGRQRTWVEIHSGKASQCPAQLQPGMAHVDCMCVHTHHPHTYAHTSHACAHTHRIQKGGWAPSGDRSHGVLWPGDSFGLGTSL